MRIFLSHARPSKPLVIRIAERLPKHVDRWLDQVELPPGTPFPLHIQRAIEEECDFLVVFVDDAALASEWVKKEVALGLRREADLGRTFVVPVLLQDVGVRVGELGALADKVYLPAWSHDEAGVADAASQLGEQLFALASTLVESLRGMGRRGMLDAFAHELAAYKQVAFMWRQLLGNRLDVVATNQALFDQVAAAVKDYNRVADDFIPRLSMHRDRLTAAWSEHRGLGEDVRDLVDEIENRVYRGAMLRLNRLHEIIHALDAGGGADAAAMAGYEAEQRRILDDTERALEDMSRRATRLIGSLEREI